jgi:putative heme-binding domain-containing protein
VPQDVARIIDFRRGRDTGRIYRLAPAGFRYSGTPRLSRSTVGDLVALLESPHGWWRDTAHRLIYERGDKSAVPALRRLLADSRVPQARLHALWSLRGLQSLHADDLLRALSDEHPSVREHALHLSDPLFETDRRLTEKCWALCEDPSPRIRLQAAFSLGEISDPRTGQVLAGMARKFSSDSWIRTAVLSSATQFAAPLLTELALDREFRASDAGMTMLTQLAGIVAGRNKMDEAEQVLRATDRIEGRVRQWQLLLALARPLARAGHFLNSTAFSQNSNRVFIDRTFQDAERISLDARQELTVRRQAISLLGCFPIARSGVVLEQLISSQQPDEIVVTALRACEAYRDDSVSQTLLARWREYPPGVRLVAMDVLFSRPPWLLALLKAARQGEVAPAQFDLARRGLLLKHANPEVRAAATELFGSESAGPRSDKIAAYKPTLHLRSDASGGQQVFRRECSSCHRLGDVGSAIGPDLASSAAREPEALLVHVLDPNQYVLPNYEQYIVVDTSGRTLTGIVAAQTATSITVKREENQSDTVLRAQIAEMYSTGKSLMPEGFEQKITHQEMADLIAYLQSVKPASGAMPLDIGTLPGLIEPE